jgi:adenosine deaminase
MSVSSGPAEAALRALTPSQLSFLERLPKAELHAHLNGSIPLPLLQDLAREYTPPSDVGVGVGVGVGVEAAADVLATVQRLKEGVELGGIDEFFKLFPAIYALTSTPASLKRATRAILSHFLDPCVLPSSASTSAAAAAVYIELRTTPRETPHMSRRVYLETVLDEIEARSPDAAALIVSLDRRMTPDVAREVLELAVQLRREGRRVVGVDLCGDPTVRSVPYLFFYMWRVYALALALAVVEPNRWGPK